jgi:hypothetical protein
LGILQGLLGLGYWDKVIRVIRIIILQGSVN